MGEEKEYTSTGREVTIIDRVFDQMVRGVFVITTRCKEKLNGMSAAWVNRSSEQPFLLAACIWKKNYSHDLIKESGIFAVNILRADQKDIARHFGKQSGRDVEKFAEISFKIGKTGAPILNDCLGFLDCQVVRTVDSGDHTIFVGEVLLADFGARGEPLLYQRKDYFNVESSEAHEIVK